MNANQGEVSDGYHTFNELYEHRHALFLALLASYLGMAWMSAKHADGTHLEGWFVAGLRLPTGDITYHLPMSNWDTVVDLGVEILPRAPDWDGHTSRDVVTRVRSWTDRYLGRVS